MGKIVLKRIALAVAFCLLPAAAFAAGLGKLTVLSALGQPLRAEIEIVSLQQNEAESLTARLASPETFRQSNIELNGALLQVRFAIETRSRGQPSVVMMTSVQPMNEPFFDMLIELSWASGKLVREYTFLLDPPEYNRGTAVAAPVQPVIPPGVQQAPALRVVEAPRPVERAPEVRPRPEEQASAPAAPVKPRATYEVKRGDTLARIADRNRVDGVSLQQMLVALYRGNTDAFDGGNMNRLPPGKTLNLPDRDTALGVSPDEARRMVGTQGAEYNQYRQGLGAAVASAPARADTGRQASGKIGAGAEDKVPTAREPARDQLKLSKVEDSKAGGKAGASLDDLAAKEKALKEANERIALLEKNVAGMKKLAQLNSQTGTQLQQQASKQVESATKVAPAAKQAAPEPAKSAAAPSPPQAAPAPAVVAAKPGTTESAAAPGGASPTVAPAPVVPSPAAKAAAPKVAVAPPAPASESAGFLDELLDNPAALGGVGGVIVLLAGYALYAVRKRRQAGVGMGAVAGMAAEANSVFGPSGGASIDTSSSQFQSDFVPGEVEKGNAEEIDPIAEADVYMAYGRDAQAEEILKESLVKDPTRQNVRVKLMEIYANRKDLGAFTVLAGELHSATGGNGPEWDKAAALGKGIDPSNPMFGGGSAAGAMDTQVMPNPDATLVMTASSLSAVAPMAEEQPTAAPELDFDLDIGAAADVPAQTGVDFVSSPETIEQAPEPTTLDFDLDMGSPQEASNVPPAVETAASEATSAPSDLGFSIDFELPAADVPAAALAPEQVTVAPTLADSDAPSIDFDLGSPGEDKPLETEAPAMDLSSITLDLGATEAFEPAQDAHWQEVATKLDLAKAYQEMGDKDGARELLNEVLKEGDEAQQKQATTMLEAVG